VSSLAEFTCISGSQFRPTTTQKHHAEHIADKLGSHNPLASWANVNKINKKEPQARRGVSEWGISRNNPHSLTCRTNVKHTWELVILFDGKRNFTQQCIFCTPFFWCTKLYDKRVKQIILHLFFVLRKSHLVGGGGDYWDRCAWMTHNKCTPKIQWNHLAYKDTFFYCNKNHLFSHLSTHT
jgi:hypothetical protein